MIRLILYTYFLLLTFSQIVLGEVFNDFKIIGSERVSEQTIINFSEVNINDDLNQNDLNNVVK